LKSAQVLVFCLLSIQLKALAVEADAQQWLNLTAQGIVSEKTPVGLYFEAQARRSNHEDEIYESLIRPAVYYQTENYGSFFFGTLSRLNHEQRKVETRHWVQWLAQPEFGQADYRHVFRLRLEQRDFENNTEDSNRIRMMVRTLHTSILSSQMRPFGSLELFYHLNRASANLQPGLSQSRTSLGLSVPLGRITTLEVSYLNMYIFNRQDAEQVNHVVNMALNINF
jgi:hypothetical protein